jgi:hypothetical protein
MAKAEKSPALPGAHRVYLRGPSPVPRLSSPVSRSPVLVLVLALFFSTPAIFPLARITPLGLPCRHAL